MQIEKASERDIDEIEKLYNETSDYLEAHVNYPGWKKGIYPAREDAEKAFSEGALFIVRENGSAAGSFILRHEPEQGYAKVNWGAVPDFEHDFVVYTLAVHPDFQHCGIGAGIMDYISRYSAENGAKAVRLDVYYKNEPAKKLYKKAGFCYIDTADLGYSEFGLEKFELYQKIL